MDSDLEHILIKYLSKSANASELDELEEWIKSPENQTVFKDFVKSHYEITYGMTVDDPSDFREELLADIRRKKQVRRSPVPIHFMRYAAIILVLVGCGFLIQQLVFTENEIALPIEQEKQITLELEDGTIQNLSEDGNQKVLANTKGEKFGSKKGRMLMYDSGEAHRDIAYNTLKVPYGKRFDLTLSDGSTVYLNAGSELRYPVLFPKNGNREVRLIGEAYFDVTKNAEKPFVITADNLNIRVYGTSFNVANYPEDDASEVVLVEGSVGLSSVLDTQYSNEDTLLEPGQKGSLQKSSGEMTAESVSTEIYTSWVQGKLIFRNMTLDNILKKLERHYDVSINNNNESLGKEKFNANFGNEPLEKVLHYFETTYGIRYTIDGKKVLID